MSRFLRRFQIPLISIGVPIIRMLIMSSLPASMNREYIKHIPKSANLAYDFIVGK